MSQSEPGEVLKKLELPEPVDDSDRWLFVQKVSAKAKGGWATGSFDPQRNKISIETHDVEGFVVDTGKIKIDWQKLVVLSIDGKNSELRRRKEEILNFDRTPSGEWVVREP